MASEVYFTKKHSNPAPRWAGLQKIYEKRMSTVPVYRAAGVSRTGLDNLKMNKKLTSLWLTACWCVS